MIRTFVTAAILAAAFAIASGPSPGTAKDAGKVGVVSNIKVLSDKVEDVSTLEDWKNTYIKPGMSEKEKALAIWRTMVKYRHQTAPPDEGISSSENVHDPMKTIHVYGYGMCCCASSNVEGLARYLGLEARGRIISLHSVPEIKVDGKWALIDCSLMNYIEKEDGSLASVDEIRDAVQGWLKDHPTLRHNGGGLREFAKKEGWRKGPALLTRCRYYDRDGINAAGWHGWPSNMEEYDFKMNDKTRNVFDYGPSMGYQVNVQLREGEKLTRCWYNKGLIVGGADDGLVKGDRAPLGEQKKLGDVAPGRIGNGMLEYDVPLASGAFRLGAIAAENLQSKSEGAASAVAVEDPAKDGELVIRMPSNYVYLTGTVALTPVIGAGGSLAVLLSENQGMDWKQVARFSQSGEAKIDLKDHVFRRYDYRLKFVLAGKGTGLDALKITHDVQHSQAPLPALLAGENRITFKAGPQEGTVTYEALVAPAEGRKHAFSYTAYHPVLRGVKTNLMQVGDTGKGEAIFTVATPGDMARIRMNFDYRARDKRDNYTVMVSYDGGKIFKTVEKLAGPTAGSSKYFTIDNVPAGTRQAQIKFAGTQYNTTCVFDLRIDADYREPAGGFRPVKVTYVWEEDGEAKRDEHVCRTAADAWTIRCGAKTVVKSYTLELAKE